jgi:hypothetical protein
VAAAAYLVAMEIVAMVLTMTMMAELTKLTVIVTIK